MIVRLKTGEHVDVVDFPYVPDKFASDFQSFRDCASVCRHLRLLCKFGNVGMYISLEEIDLSDMEATRTLNAK